MRKIVDIKSHLHDSRASKFIDLKPSDSSCDSQAQQLLQELRDNKIIHRLPKNNISTYEIDWNACGASAGGMEHTVAEEASDKHIMMQPPVIQSHDDATASVSPKNDTNGNDIDDKESDKIKLMSGNVSVPNQLNYSSIALTGSNTLVADMPHKYSGLGDENAKNINHTSTEKHNKTSNNNDFVRHSQYLNAFCNHFYEELKDLIRRSDVTNRHLYNEMTVETLQHLHFARLRCAVFEGRHDVISSIKEYLSGTSTAPLIIYGKSGSGKTSVLAKVFQQIESWSKEASDRMNRTALPETDDSKTNQLPKGDTKKIITVLRFLGTTPLTSNLRCLLSSICSQLSITLSSPPWKMPEKLSELIRDFHKMLKLANRHQRLLLMLDSVDQLMPTYEAYKVTWLPCHLPRYVKLIVSTLDEGYDILKNLRGRYGSNGGTFIEIKDLGKDVGLEILSRLLEKSGRRITTQQTDVIREALGRCSIPLYARIAFDQIRRWCSYDLPTSAELESTVKGAINQLFDQMEQKFGQPIVKHSLSYLTAARHGLSEVELEHLLSLDDVLLNEVFSFWCPPIRRIPPLLWTRVRADINSYVVERSADDRLVLRWYHRQFVATTQSRYLSDVNFECTVHQIMAEYFSGRWGGGKEKPFKYTDAQMKRFQLNVSLSKADRKVPVQPYFFSSDETSCSILKPIIINARKSSELPYHYLKIGENDKLLKNIFFNYEWLFAKLYLNKTQSILQEFEYFMDANKQLSSNHEMKILVANIQLIRPYVDTFPLSLAYELSGRLSKYVGNYPLITRLIRSCDGVGISHCALTPILTCFESADLGLKQNITVRTSEPWHEGGAMTCTAAMTTMYIVDYDQDDIPNLYVWDVKGLELLSATPIKKLMKVDTMDVYIQLKLTNDESHLLACYIQKYYGVCK